MAKTLHRGASSGTTAAFISIVAVTLAAWACGSQERGSQAAGYEGSLSCKGCHENFYDLWSPSHHGLAMQPFTPEFAGSQIDGQPEDIVIGEYGYRAEIEDGIGWVRERGPEGEREYRIEHAMGGKNVYFFLTELERGRLQVLPVAFDVRHREWYNTTASMVRHFGDVEDEAIDWREPALTFNTSCYSCHVSQLSTNYDLETDAYNTVWVEPGINCETCHGAGGEHVRVCDEDSCPEDAAIIGLKEFTAQQVNDMCAPCHAKVRPLTVSFLPGERFFDHYDVVGLEDEDFHPDGRDLGENFTYTLWLTSPCLASTELDCLHCHTTSGRYLFEGENSNDACLPCHEERVGASTAHTHHPAGSQGDRCVACHMPTTEFARMRRSDHSMRPPTPAVTLAFGSPNACNICHDDQDAAWADRWVRQWRSHDYQAPVLYRAGLIEDARRLDHSRLPEMLAYLESENRDAVFAASLIRLLEVAVDDRVWPVIARLLRDDPSPLVRGAAATTLGTNLTRATGAVLLEATEDDYRVVRIRAANALAGYPRDRLTVRQLRNLDVASGELEAALRSRPDDLTSHYALGTYYLNRGDLGLALLAYETALEVQPDFAPTLINIGMIHARLGEREEAEGSLRQALEVDPSSAAAHFNLGLLLAEYGDTEGGETHLRLAIAVAPEFAEAAYNLCVLLSDQRIEEAIEWCRTADELGPDQPRHAYTLAFYLYENGEVDAAARTLRRMIERGTGYVAAYELLGTIYEQEGSAHRAVALYRQAMQSSYLVDADKLRIEGRLLRLQPQR
jgi:tetratricopeptide (TPR) repeat protein